MLRESLGLCPYHAWLLVDLVRRNPYLDALGPSIIYEDMLTTLISRIESKHDSTLSHIGSCLICRYVEDYERIYVDELSTCMEKSDLLELYAKSSSILCLRHYTMVLNNIQSVNARNRLRQIQLRKLRELLESVRAFIRKQDYKVREEPSKAEALAWIRVVEVLKGYKTSTTILHDSRVAGKGIKHRLRKLVPR